MRSPALLEPLLLIGEHTGSDLIRVTDRANRWLGLAIAFGTAVIGFGFAGGAWEPPPAVVASPPVTIQQPAPPMQSTVAAPGLLGQAADEPASLVASILDVSMTTPHGPASVSLRSMVGTGQSGRDSALLVDGFAPSTIDSVTIDIRTRTGRLLAAAVAKTTVDDERPGSGGKPRVGVATLQQPMVVLGPIPVDGWQVEINWRDVSTGPSGSATLLVLAFGD